MWESIDIKAARLEDSIKSRRQRPHQNPLEIRNIATTAVAQWQRQLHSREKKRNKRSGRNDKTENILIIRLCVVIQLITKCRIQHSGFSYIFFFVAHAHSTFYPFALFSSCGLFVSLSAMFTVWCTEFCAFWW